MKKNEDGGVSMSFINKMQETLNDEFNVSMTENFALGYKTTGKALLDMNFAVASLRRATDEDIINRFTKAYFEDKQSALTWLFYARDVRGGLGERRLFRVIFDHLAKNMDIPIVELMALVNEYGRFDDLLCLLRSKHHTDLMAIIKEQLERDLSGIEAGTSISLLAKWLPSINATNANVRENARVVANELSMNWSQYRKTLSKLRKYLDVVERKMSAGQWDEIRYDAVPSRANLLYNRVFLRRDEERRRSFLETLKKGEAKINAGVLHPHEIVNAYMGSRNMWQQALSEYDETLEQLWKALPSVPELDNTIVVADGSGSMMTAVGGSSCTALSVANALAIYFAEHSKGEFCNKYITFSEQPQLVDLSNGNSLREKLQIALAHNEIANTDVHAVFKLILTTAVKSNMVQDELPKNIVIISDMEFDGCTKNVEQRLFSKISDEYAQHGYKLPRLIFWNVNSRTGTIPVMENELGVALVSGFSISIAKMVMSLELDPYRCLLEILNSPRYEAVREIVANLDFPSSL